VRQAIEQLVDERVEERIAAMLATSSKPTSPYMTVDEAARYIGAHRQRIYDLRSSGRLSRIGDGSRALVSRDELDEYLNGRRTR
jgi:excisionase family DNA binding protein